MTRSIFRAVLLTSALAVLASPVAAQATSPSASTPPTATSINGAEASTTLGCYQDPGTLISQGDYAFQSLGYCQNICVGLQKPVMAVTNGSTCYCGDELPPIYQKVDLSNCDTPCTGFALSTCGGVGFWQISLTGLAADVETLSNITTTSTSSSAAQSSGSSTSQTAVATKPTATSVVTPSATTSPDQYTGTSGSNRSPSPWMSLLVFSVLLPLLARCRT